MNISNESNLYKDKIVYDITKFSHLDYPDHLACIIWFSGCNMLCDFCYNKEIVFAKNADYDLNDVLEFLKQRVGLLDGVVLSGGEATNYDLAELCREIKKLGFKIKLDTNGTNFQELQLLCDSNLIDYIALDYKAPSYKYKQITKSSKYDAFSMSLQYLISSHIDFEVRTTLHPDLLQEDDINHIIKDLKNRGYSHTYYIQEFLYTGTHIGDIHMPVNTFDTSLLVDDIKIVYR
ncbi:MAG: anaerobic ribonucleoside-triphosphate reductase activating protein [Helicobacteraceae bacterium]|nr:anaerobic ribonucleoside-triphosphate reductase activating protein [Candidatus Sulfurimonas ponti]